MGNNACCADTRGDTLKNQKLLDEKQQFQLKSGNALKSTPPPPSPPLPPIQFQKQQVPKLNDRVQLVFDKKKDNQKQTKKVQKYGADLYEGQTDEDKKPSGYGVMYKPDESVFMGNFKAGKADGKGVFIFPDGSFYEGTMCQNSANDFHGIYQSENVYYEGGFKDNVFNGEGKEIGKTYEFKGIYEQGRRQKGTLKWTQGEEQYTYIGYFDQNGQFKDQNGRLESSKGNFQGHFVNGEKNGKGIYRYKTKIMYDGEYKNNQKNGFGKIINEDHSIAFQGQFLNGLPNGKGYATDNKGKKFELVWNQGVYSKLKE